METASLLFAANAEGSTSRKWPTRSLGLQSSTENATALSVLGMTTELPTVAPDPRAICTSAGGGGGGGGTGGGQWMRIRSAHVLGLYTNSPPTC